MKLFKITIPSLITLLLLGSISFISISYGGGRRTISLGDLTINSNEVWSNKTVIINGKLTIAPGGSLTLKNVILNLNPKVEDSDSVAVNGGAFTAINSTIRSSSAKQWNLEATGASQLTFENTTATNHTGIRLHDDSGLNANASEIEEVQCHDNARLNIKDGSAVYIVLFFVNALEALNNGELKSGEEITRIFDFKSSPTTTGHVSIEDSIVWGFQLDLVGSTNLSISDGSEIVLALHLENVSDLIVPDSITSPTPKSGNISLKGQNFNFSNSQISYINVYACGDNSNVTFTGTNRVIECSVFDNAKLTFESNTFLIADLASASYGGTLTINGVKLISDYTHPSITAMYDGARVILNQVNALEGTTVYAEQDGTVYINGGLDWKDSMFEETDNGRIIYTPE